MTDTDDTDELLLIPPDFFVSHPLLDRHSSSIVPYYSVVDSVIVQLNQLEDRISFIESSSERSFNMSSPRRNFDSEDSFNKMGSTSSQSTPQRPRLKFTLHSLPNSPDVKKSPQKGRRGKVKEADVNPMLGEIDSFLSNVKQIRRLNASRNLEFDFQKLDGSKNFDRNQVGETLKEKPMVKEKAWQMGDDISSVPDYGRGMRKNMYPSSRRTYTVDGISNDKTDTESSSESQVTALENNKPTVDDSYNLGLLSLAKLWTSDALRNAPAKYEEQLQEEKLRRQHCEQAIQELQHRVLELQERVAVAIQVDEAKDKAILRFHDSWERAGGQLQDLEKVKDSLEEEVVKLRKQLSEESDGTHQKIFRYEQEASKALNLAHSSQDKLAVMERRYGHLENELKKAEVRAEEMQRKYQAEVEKNRQYPEIIAQKELELNDCKSVMSEARKEMSQSNRAVELCQSELMTVKDENDSLRAKLASEKDHVKKLNEQKSKLLEEINAHKSVARGLQEELMKARDQVESSKVELKNFYQGQVELVVQNKLKEFQGQLDEAEKNLKEELAKKEMSIAKTAASHIQQISEKHSIEIKLLEEKHHEECRLYQLQLSQLHHQLEESHLKLKRQNDKHVHIERQLHKFMESLRQDHVTTLDEIHSFRSKSFNNLEEILAFNMAEEDRNRKEDVAEAEKYKMVETPLSSRNEKGSRRKESSLQETIQMLLDKKGQGDKKETREGAMQLYKMSKDGRDKRPWK